MDEGMARTIAMRFVSPVLSWGSIRNSLNTHRAVLGNAGVLIESRSGEFSFVRKFAAWERIGKGICVEFEQHEKIARVQCFLVRMTGTIREIEASIEEPDPVECLVAVFTSVPIRRLKISLLDV